MAANNSAEMSRAVNMLREAADLIDVTLQNRSSPVPEAISGTMPTPYSPEISPVWKSSACTSTTSTSCSSSDSELRNFRNLFSAYPPRGGDLPSTSARNQWDRPTPAKRQKKSKVHFIPKDTWTHEFLCLANTDAETTPTRQEKLLLQSAGLGRKKIVLGSKDSAKKVQERLEAAFPKLADAGGFEILRSGGSPKQLVLVRPPPHSGYSVPFLRNNSGLGQALAYVRPLQRDLDTTPEDSPLQLQVMCELY